MLAGERVLAPKPSIRKEIFCFPLTSVAQQTLLLTAALVGIIARTDIGEVSTQNECAEHGTLGLCWLLVLRQANGRC